MDDLISSEDSKTESSWLVGLGFSDSASGGWSVSTALPVNSGILCNSGFSPGLASIDST